MSINNFHFAGYLGSDVRYNAQHGVTNLSVATTLPTKDKKTQWVSVSVWNNGAREMADWYKDLKKGDYVSGFGYVEARVYDGKNGAVAELLCTVNQLDVLRINSKQEQQPASAPARSQQSAPDNYDDDIPF